MVSRSFLSSLLLSVLAYGIAGSPVPADPSQPEPAGYVFTSFRGGGDGLHLAYGFDGMDWTGLSRVPLRPQVGSKLFRDPHLVAGPDGYYHMVWTTGWHDKGIGYARSRDLLEWSEQRFLPLTESIPGVETTWAPEVYWLDDEEKYLLVWSSAVPAPGETKVRHRAWFSLTKDFHDFSKPAILFDPGFDHIDTTLARHGGKWVAIFKETDDQAKGIWGAIRGAVADHPLGPYRLLDSPVIEKERAERPTVFQSASGKFIVYFNDPVKNRSGARESDDLKTWRDVSGDIAVAPGQHHGSILPVPSAILEGLRAEEKEIIASVPAPALPEFTADPAIRAFGNRYYIYPTTDRPNWNTKEFAVWSSPDLITWKKEAVFLDLRKDITWADNQAWAPDCIERDGKYFFYFCAEGNIGVAVGNSPIGPFRDALGRPLVEDKKIKTYSIDPHAFIDDDGQAYLYFGNGTPTVWKLNRDMISFAGDPIEFPLREFREGIVVFKRHGKYYFMWSIDDARSPDYRVGWGWSDSPTGPVVSPDKDFIVLRQNGHAKGTAHHGLVNVPGTDRWYVAYHRHAVPGGGGYKRQIVLARMEFNPDGTIRPMDPLVPAFPPGHPGEPITRP